MNMHLKIKLLFLAGIIALALVFGTLGVASKIQASNSIQLAGPCWKCGG
jgi:hypothetical protein